MWLGEMDALHPDGVATALFGPRGTTFADGRDVQHANELPFDLEVVRRPLSERIRPTPAQVEADLAATQPAPVDYVPPKKVARVLGAVAIAALAAGLVTAVVRLNLLPRKRWS
jgi:hypothetical protein